LAQEDKQPTLRSIYKTKYRQVERKFGNGAAGRNIVLDGVAGAQGDRPAHHGEIARSIRTMRSMLAPAPVQAAPTAYAPTVGASNPLPPTSYSGNGSYSIPESIVQCESGGDYGAVNPGSGARGAYQLMPSTYQAYGGDGSWSKADQDRVAAKVWNGGAGRGQWVC
jgi:hypothetical protein